MIQIKDNKFIQSLIVLASAVILVYFVPPAINRFLFFPYLFLAWRSKNDYFWLAVIFIISNYPGGLFSGGEAADQYRLPLYTIIPDFSISFFQLYLAMILIKAIREKRRILIIYKNSLSKLAFYFVLLVLISFPLGFSLENAICVSKTAVQLSLYYSVFFIIRDYESFVKFFRIIFPYVFITFLLQIYSITFHQQLIALFKPGVTVIQGVLVGEILRTVEMPDLLLLCFVGSLFFLVKKGKEFKQVYLLSVSVISVFSILFTATRSWFLGFAMVYLVFAVINRKTVRQFFTISISAIFLFGVLYFSVPIIKNQIDSSWNRISTVEELVKGDIAAHATFARLSIAVPKVMAGFYKSTILLGAGFSNIYFEYANGHVGYQNILLNTGIFGFIILFSFIFKLIYKTLVFSKKTHNNELSIMLKNSILGFVAILVINAGTQYYGYTIGEFSRVIVLAFLLAWVNILTLEYYKEKMIES